MDGQRAGHERAAVDELVRRVDDAFALVGLEGAPGGFEEVEVTCVAFGAFVYDLVFGGWVLVSLFLTFHSSLLGFGGGLEKTGSWEFESCVG